MTTYLTDGFDNQRLIVLPRDIRKSLSEGPLTGKHFITDIGFFPKALHHRRDRAEGTGEYICIYCKSGSGWLRFGGETRTVSAGEVLFIPAGTTHSYGASEDDPWSIYWIHFYGADIPEFSAGREAIPWLGRLSDAAEGEFIFLFDQIYLRLAGGYERGNMIIVSQMAGYLLALLFFSTRRERDESGRRGDAVERCLALMANRLESRLSLEELAAEANYSVPHLSAVFREKTGVSPMHYYHQLKIQRACLILDTTDLGVAEAGRAVGYGDSYYFSRLFKKIMKISPDRYRRIQKG